MTENEKELYAEGMRAGITMTLNCLKQEFPIILENIQLSIDKILLDNVIKEDKDESCYN